MAEPGAYPMQQDHRDQLPLFSNQNLNFQRSILNNSVEALRTHFSREDDREQAAATPAPMSSTYRDSMLKNNLSKLTILRAKDNEASPTKKPSPLEESAGQKELKVKVNASQKCLHERSFDKRKTMYNA